MKSPRKSPDSAVARFREGLRERGLVKRELWILPEHTAQLAALGKLMREPGGLALPGCDDADAPWTLDGIMQVLQSTAAAKEGLMEIRRVEGAEPSLRLTLHSHGGLVVWVAVSAELIVVEAYLWPEAHVSDPAAFNAFVLRTHKYFPLTTISLSQVGGVEGYTMFGALDARSSLSSLLFEIETLASNVLLAANLYADHVHSHAGGRA